MKKNSNSYIFLFSSVMVVVVAVLLSTASTGLAPLQKKNVRVEKMRNILQSVNVESDTENAENLFDQYITGQVVLNAKGLEAEGSVTAFDIDLKEELDKARTGNADQQLFPLFVGNKDGKTYFIIPLRGKGLWGPIWGFISLEQDLSTVYGASFGHKSETPGLGAEIETPAFQQQFTGKKIFDENGKFVSVEVIKGNAAPENPHGVDAISGATVTSIGVSEMLESILEKYIPYFEKRKSGIANK